MDAPVSPALLALLRCPVTLQPLRVATAEELARLPEPLTAALIREDGLAAFPIREGLPHVTADAMLSL